MTDKQIAKWLLTTLQMFNVSTANAYKITGLFFEALDAEKESK